ncbi:hypothetical protein PFISCL1PPCAC_3850, partial [Pristionchus fissidentatus]
FERSSMQFLLLLYLLLPFTAGAGLNDPCPKDSACLLFKGCNATIDSVVDRSTHSSPPVHSCPADSTEAYILVSIKPETSRKWRFEVSTTFDILEGLILHLGQSTIQYVNEGILNATVEGRSFEIEVVTHREDDADAITHSDFTLKDKENTEWLAIFAGSSIGMSSP